MDVIKRDGTFTKYDVQKIENAIQKAINQTESNIHADMIAAYVDSKIKSLNKNTMSVQEIHYFVEDALMDFDHDTARAYVEYRKQRDLVRESSSVLMTNVKGLIEQTNDEILNENANKDAKIIPTQRDLLAGIISKHCALNQILPRDVANAHTDGDIHYHDLDYSPFFQSFNCFSRDTKFITINGLKSFEDYDDGDIVYVPSHTGKIRKAIVKCYGDQPLNKITFKRGKGFRTVRATSNHRWLTQNGESTNLKIGDKLIHAPNLKDGEFNLIDWCRGFGYGDGWMNDGGFRIRISQPKLKYTQIFIDAGFNVTYPNSYNGDAHVSLKGYKKELPDSSVDIRSFCLGYAAADATSRASSRGILATGEESINFIRENFDTAGLYIGSEKDVTDHKTNYGKRSDKSVAFCITSPNHYRWVVNDIISDNVESVWCLEVEKDHSFILQGGIPTGNCMLIDVNNMLTNGFKMGNARIETPKSIETATAVTAQIIAQVASHIYGGNTINRIDEILAPYVTMTYEKELKKLKDIREATKQELLKTVFSHEVQKMLATDDLLEELAKTYTEKHVYDAFQSLEYEINTLHCANGQTPFTTLGFGLGTSWESRMIQKAILKVRLEGLGKEKHTAIFPKLVFAIKKGVNFGLSDPNYDIKQLALECSAKRMYPDILNYDKTVEVTGSFKFPMGCRSFLDQWFDENGNEVHEGRNNLGVVSLNLPRIGIEAKQNKEKFFEILNDRLEICHKALKTRIQRLENVKASVAPILYCEGAMGVRLKPEDNVSELFKNGRASISLGYIGLHEVANSMFGEKEHTFDSKEKQEFIISVIKKLKNAVNSWRQESGYGYSLYSTPSESLCNRFCSLDVKKFGTIQGVNDKGYYTNSFHLDVEKSVNPYEKILFEKEFVPFASGGFINYGEYPNMQKNIEALEHVWDFSYDHVPYYGTNTPVDKCFVCNYSGEFTATSEGYECPKCHNKDGKKMNVIRRVCGYLGEPDARPFIYGKQQEVMRRVKHL